MQAVVIAPGQLLKQVLDVADIADGQHFVQAAAVAPGAPQQRDRDEPADGQDDEAAGQGDEEEAAGNGRLGGVGDEAAQRHHADGALEQRLDLLGAGADALALVGPADGQQRDPGGRQQHGRCLVQERVVVRVAEPQAKAAERGQADDHDIHQEQGADVPALPAGGLRERPRVGRVVDEAAPAAKGRDRDRARAGLGRLTRRHRRHNQSPPR